MHVLYALFAGNGFARAFSGARIGARALAAHGQTAAVADSAIAADIPHAGDVLQLLPTELAFDNVVVLDVATQTAHFIIGKGLGSDVWFYSEMLEDLQGLRWSDAIDIPQGDTNPFVIRNVDAGDSGHFLSPSLDAVCGAGLCK